ncbi:MAG: catalase, partial [Candidatus Dormibacteria bacterium]
STGWQERIAPHEEQRFERRVPEFARFQRRVSQRHGNGRALHRHAVLALHGVVDVYDGLPEHARHGLFAQPGRHDAVTRLSNASMHVQPDKVPDIRGFAIKVRDVSGPGALGGETDEQDFVLINLPTFRLSSSDPFADVVIARSKGNAAVVRHMLRRYGPFRFLRQARHGIESLKWPFSGFLTEPFHSAAPLRCGPYAVRVRILPRDARPPAADARDDWAADVRHRLAEGAAMFDVQLQFFVDESITPIEDASIDWPQDEAPYITVGRLTIPQQETTGAGYDRFAADVEAMSFDPWHALDDHRPLGEVMRARRAAYYASVRERRAAAGVTAAA